MEDIRPYGIEDQERRERHNVSPRDDERRTFDWEVPQSDDEVPFHIPRD